MTTTILKHSDIEIVFFLFGLQSLKIDFILNLDKLQDLITSCPHVFNHVLMELLIDLEVFCM